MRTPRQLLYASLMLREIAASHRAAAEKLRETDVEAADRHEKEEEKYGQFAELLEWALGSETSEDSLFCGLLGELVGEETAEWHDPSSN